MTRLIILAGIIMALATPALAETSVLRSLPAEVQRDIEGVRAQCRGLEGVNYGTSGDEGLIQFTVSGMSAVLVDSLNLCDGQCLKGTNCATGYTHQVDIYVRAGNAWRKAFSKDVTEPVLLDAEFTGPPYGKFKALVVKVHAGWEKECPAVTNEGTEWKRRSCTMVVKWDGTRFTWRPL
jgi:hypothetical protein